MKSLISSALFGLAGLTAALSAPSASAASTTQELIVGSNGSLRFGGDNTLIGFDVGYRYFLLPESGLQVGADLSFNLNDAGETTNTVFDFFPVARYNLAGEPGLLNSLFVDLGLGVNVTDSTDSDSQSRFVFGGGLGRRFEISDRVTWTPRVLVRKVEDSSADLTITPIAISIFF